MSLRNMHYRAIRHMKIPVTINVLYESLLYLNIKIILQPNVMLSFHVDKAELIKVEKMAIHKQNKAKR